MTTITFDNRTNTVAESLDQPEPSTLNRREFLTYAWGMAATFLLAEAGADCFSYLYPRFRLGEFGGQFNLGAATTLPTTDAAPLPNLDGKFWLVNTAHGPKALYMVCTHLGCTPNWLEAEQKFKCPCHGSGFYKDGINFEGPAPRPLERYAIRISDDGQIEIDKSKKFQEELGQWADPTSFIAV